MCSSGKYVVYCSLRIFKVNFSTQRWIIIILPPELKIGKKSASEWNIFNFSGSDEFGDNAEEKTQPLSSHQVF